MRHWIQATVAPRMAAQDAPRGQVATLRSAMLLEGIERIPRACRLEPAGAAEPGAEKVAIGAHRHRQDAARPKTKGRPCAHARATRANTSANSARTAACSWAEDALVNRLASIGARRRISHCPGASPRWLAAACARICRLTRFRVTACRAWRLGTTRPSQNRPSGPMLSTTPSRFGASAVDISGTTAPLAGREADAGRAAIWCSAKWGLLAMAGVVSAAAKSAVFRVRQAA